MARKIMKKIMLTRYKVAWVDNDDFESLNKWKWYAVRCRNRLYAVRSIKNESNMSMHREILGLSKGDGMQADHINGDGLDNRRSNLRTCTSGQNSHNRALSKANVSGLKGVSWDEQCKKWRAYIIYKGRARNLGRYFCIMKAARVYDNAARKLFGEFAWLNFAS